MNLLGILLYNFFNLITLSSFNGLLILIMILIASRVFLSKYFFIFFHLYINILLHIFKLIFKKILRILFYSLWNSNIFMVYFLLFINIIWVMIIWWYSKPLIERLFLPIHLKLLSIHLPNLTSLSFLNSLFMQLLLLKVKLLNYFLKRCYFIIWINHNRIF